MGFSRFLISSCNNFVFLCLPYRISCFTFLMPLLIFGNLIFSFFLLLSPNADWLVFLEGEAVSKSSDCLANREDISLCFGVNLCVRIEWRRESRQKN